MPLKVSYPFSIKIILPDAVWVSLGFLTVSWAVWLWVDPFWRDLKELKEDSESNFINSQAQIDVGSGNEAENFVTKVIPKPKPKPKLLSLPILSANSISSASLSSDLNTPNPQLRVDGNTLDTDLRAYPNNYPNNYPNTYPNAFPLEKQVSPSSVFGIRIDPLKYDLEHHKGIDLASEQGSPILATATGSVIAAGYDRGYGNQITIDHGNGFVTKYAHAEQLLVRVGDYVQQSQTIARVGSSGKSTGSHLHYEISYQGHPINPQFLLSYLMPPIYTPLKMASNRNLDHIKKSEPMDQRRLINISHIEKKQFYGKGDMVAVVKVRSGRVVQ